MQVPTGYFIKVKEYDPFFHQVDQQKYDGRLVMLRIHQ